MIINPLKKNRFFQVTAIISCFMMALLVMTIPVHAASQKEILSLQKQVNAQAKQLETLNQQINNDTNRINQLNREANDLDQKIGSQKKVLGERVKNMYMYGNISYLSYLFDAKTGDDMITRLENIRTILNSDANTLKQYEAAKEQKQATLNALQSDLNQIQNNKKQVESSQQELNKKLSKLQGALSSYSSSGHNTANVGTDANDFICACVAAEGGSSYESALAIISCVMNRVDSGRWGGHDAVSVLTAPGQFSVYRGGQYKRFTGGRAPAHVKKAVDDCMNHGIRNHPYQSFRSGSSYGVWNCGGNSFR